MSEGKEKKYLLIVLRNCREARRTYNGITYIKSKQSHNNITPPPSLSSSDLNFLNRQTHNMIYYNTDNIHNTERAARPGYEYCVPYWITKPLQ